MDPRFTKLFRWGIENSTQAQQDSAAKPADDTIATGIRAIAAAPDVDAPASSTADRPVAKPVDPQILQALFGGPSDADMMKKAMIAIRNPETDLENRLTAFDNFEQYVEGIDNANNIEKLRLTPEEEQLEHFYADFDELDIVKHPGLWSSLFEELDNKDPQLRSMAAWCISTAVQNNDKSQVKLTTIARVFPDSAAENKATFAKLLLEGKDTNKLKDIQKYQRHTLLQKLVDLALNDPDKTVRKKCINALSSGVRNCQPTFDLLLETLPIGLKPLADDANNMEAIDQIIALFREASAEKS